MVITTSSDSGETVKFSTKKHDIEFDLVTTSSDFGEVVTVKSITKNIPDFLIPKTLFINQKGSDWEVYRGESFEDYQKRLKEENCSIFISNLT